LPTSRGPPRCGCAGSTNLAGAEQEDAFDGLWATCVQHEIDHLNGKLFIDYLRPFVAYPDRSKRQMITRKMPTIVGLAAPQAASAIVRPIS
jgi:hypothetical protein